MFLQILLLLAIGGYTVNGQFNTSSCADFDSQIVKCYTDNNLQVGIDTTMAQIQQLFLQDTTETCGSSKDSIKNAIGCFIDLLRGCVPGNENKLIASSSNYKEAFDILCSDESTDRNCAGVKTCLFRKLKAGHLNPLGPFPNETYTAKKDHMCKQAEYYLTCVNENAEKSTCGGSVEKNRKIVTKLTPEACGAMSVIYTSILLVASLFVTVYNVVV